MFSLSAIAKCIRELCITLFISYLASKLGYIFNMDLKIIIQSFMQTHMNFTLALLILTTSISIAFIYTLIKNRRKPLINKSFGCMDWIQNRKGQFNPICQKCKKLCSLVETKEKSYFTCPDLHIQNTKSFRGTDNPFYASELFKELNPKFIKPS